MFIRLSLRFGYIVRMKVFLFLVLSLCIFGQQTFAVGVYCGDGREYHRLDKADAGFEADVVHSDIFAPDYKMPAVKTNASSLPYRPTEAKLVGDLMHLLKRTDNTPVMCEHSCPDVHMVENEVITFSGMTDCLSGKSKDSVKLKSIKVFTYSNKQLTGSRSYSLLGQDLAKSCVCIK